MIYFDSASTSKPLPAAVQAAAESLTKGYANPSAAHQEGRKVKEQIEKVRALFAAHLGCSSGECFFTSGATEANNFILQNFRTKKGGDKLLSFTTEHPSVRTPIQERGGCLLDPFKEGLTDDRTHPITWERLRPFIDKTVSLVSLIHINNETGVINDIDSVGQGLKNEFPDVHFHVDAAQSFLKTAADFTALCFDSISLSAHKFHGPKGIGMIAFRRRPPITPLLLGGGQEGGIRSGTENTAGIISAGAALAELKNSAGDRYKKGEEFKKALYAHLNRIDYPIEWFDKQNEPAKNQSPWITNFSLPKMPGEIVVRMLSDRGIYISNGAACASKAKGQNQVLSACGKNRSYIEGALRVSFSMENNETEIKQLAEALREIIADFF